MGSHDIITIIVMMSCDPILITHWFIVVTRQKHPPTHSMCGRMLLSSDNNKSMGKCKTAVTPLLMHWSYCSLELSHQNNVWSLKVPHNFRYGIGETFVCFYAHRLCYADVCCIFFPKQLSCLLDFQDKIETTAPGEQIPSYTIWSQ